MLPTAAKRAWPVRPDPDEVTGDRVGGAEVVREMSSIGQVTAGLNFRPTEDSVLKFDYVRGRGRDEFNNLGQHAFFLASLATYF